MLKALHFLQTTLLRVPDSLLYAIQGRWREGREEGGQGGREEREQARKGGRRGEGRANGAGGMRMRPQ